MKFLPQLDFEFYGRIARRYAVNPEFEEYSGDSGGSELAGGRIARPQPVVISLWLVDRVVEHVNIDAADVLQSRNSLLDGVLFVENVL